MRKIPLFLSLAILLATFPTTVSAAGIKVILNDKTIVFPDAQPYKKGNEVWIPLRSTAQALGMNISLAKGANKVQLVNPQLDISFQIGGTSAVINKKQTVSFGAEAIVKQNRVYVPLAFFSKVLGWEASFNNESSEAVISLPKEFDTTVSTSIVNLLYTEAYQQLSDDYFDDSIKQAIPVEALQAGWEQITSAAGSFVGIQAIQPNPDVTDGEEIHVLMEFTKTNAALIINLNNNGKVIGLRLSLAQPSATLPASLMEEEVTVDAGTDYPLQGTLTLPRDTTGPLPAVVLVQGSGPSDRDETAGAYKPFRDIAWGLAEQGIAVIRYDKRTFVYGKDFTPDMLAKFTVKDETIDDAIAASKLLKGDKRIDSSQVYIAGHSLGGMLAPRIDAEGGNFTGLVILAGSTRPLWEISADQNADIVQAMDDKDPTKKTYEDMIASELLKAKNIRNLSDSEAIAETVFGMPAHYLKEMDEHSAADIVGKLTKPILVLQGEDDFQVYANKDYPLWQDQLKSNAKASFKLYPGLNHFFVNYDGEGKNTVNEYNYPGVVDSQVIQDIANWIHNK